MQKELITSMHVVSNTAGNHKMPFMMIGKLKILIHLKMWIWKVSRSIIHTIKKVWIDGKEFFDNQFVRKVKRFSKENGLPSKALLPIDYTLSCLMQILMI